MRKKTIILTLIISFCALVFYTFSATSGVPALAEQSTQGITLIPSTDATVFESSPTSFYRRVYGSTAYMTGALILTIAAVDAAAVENYAVSVVARSGNEYIYVFAALENNFSASSATLTVTVSHKVDADPLTIVSITEVDGFISSTYSIIISPGAGSLYGEAQTGVVARLKGAESVMWITNEDELYTAPESVLYSYYVYRSGIQLTPPDVYNDTDLYLSAEYTPVTTFYGASDYSTVNAVNEAAASTSSWAWLSSVFDIVDTFFDIEFAPGIKLWYIVAIPVAFAILLLFISIIKR